MRCRLQLPGRLAGVADQFVDRVDCGLHRAVAMHHRAEHHFLGQLVGFRLDHQHSALGACHHQVELRTLQLGRRRIHDVFTVEVADARRPDRPLERNAGQRQRGRRTDQSRDVRIDFGINRQHVYDDLHFVEESIRKQRTNRAVDQARRQRLLFRGTPLALEESARDSTGRVSLFDVVDSQREEVLARFGLFARNDRRKHDGVIHRADDRSARLARDLARFQRHRVRAVRECLRDLFKHLAFLSFLFVRRRSSLPLQRRGTLRYRRLGAEDPTLRPYRSAHVAGQRQTACVDHPTQAV
jgi:hypothetical protein